MGFAVVAETAAEIAEVQTAVASADETAAEIAEGIVVRTAEGTPEGTVVA